jgi:hypothetical protein
MTPGEEMMPDEPLAGKEFRIKYAWLYRSVVYVLFSYLIVTFLYYCYDLLVTHRAELPSRGPGMLALVINLAYSILYRVLFLAILAKLLAVLSILGSKKNPFDVQVQGEAKTIAYLIMAFAPLGIFYEFLLGLNLDGGRGIQVLRILNSYWDDIALGLGVLLIAWVLALSDSLRKEQRHVI